MVYLLELFLIKIYKKYYIIKPIKFYIIYF